MQREIRLALAVAFAKDKLGLSTAEIAERTGASQAEIRAALARLRKAAPQIDRDAD